MARLFISHSSANNGAAFALRDWLAEQGFSDVFLDIDVDRGLVAGERWQEALKAAADRCEAVLFLISPGWLDSKWCLAEFLLAKTLHKRIFGLIVDAVPLSRIPTEMTAEWQTCDLTKGDATRTFEVTVGQQPERVVLSTAALDMLRRGLDRAGLDARSFPWPPPGDPQRAPYRGLRALEPQDAAIFFGRDAMIVRGLDRLRGMVEDGVEPLMVVLGASGSGKSSFLRAGLLPRLTRDDAVFLPLPVIRPEMAVISGSAGLAQALAGAFERLQVSQSLGSIKETIAGGSAGFSKLLDELWQAASKRLVHLDQPGAGPAIVISVDQAEELFNPDGAEEAAKFLALLAAVLAPDANAPARRVLVLATIRSDRYELLQEQQTFASVKRQLFDLPPISSGEFKSVIEGPAHRVVEAGGVLRIDPALTEQLIADAMGADALPLLGFTLERLYTDYGPTDVSRLMSTRSSAACRVRSRPRSRRRSPSRRRRSSRPRKMSNWSGCARRSCRGSPVSNRKPAHRCGAWRGSTKFRRTPARSSSGWSAPGCLWPIVVPASTSSKLHTRACCGNGPRWRRGWKPMPMI